MSDGKRITLRLTMGERTWELLWQALTNHEDTVREGDDGRYTAADRAAYERLMTSVVRQKDST